MHNNDADGRRTRMAYMDGELSGPERAEFEKNLTPEQRKTIAWDRAIQDGVVDCLKRISPCPNALWDRALSKMRSPSPTRRTRRIFELSAVAACLVLGFSLFYVNRALSGSIEIEVNLPKDVTKFAEDITIEGDQETIEDVLHANGFNVSIGDIATCNRQHRHRIALLGMKMLELGDRKYPCAQLYFSCCRRPVSTFVVKESPRITAASFKAAGPSGDVHRMSHNANGYLIVTMSHHATSVVGSLFEGPLPDGQEQTGPDGVDPK